jgi:hypothetical protein
MWEMWLIDDWSKKTVDSRMFGVEPSIAKEMKKMSVGDTIYINGYYNYQIIRKS